MFGWVQFGQRDRIRIAQGLNGDQGRAGIGGFSMCFSCLTQGVDVGVIGCKPRLGAFDPLCRLTGLDRLIRAQIIKRAARMGLDITERFVLAS